MGENDSDPTLEIYLQENMAACNVPFQMHIYPKGKHGLSTADMQTANEIRPDADHVKDWLDAVKKWLKQTLDIA